MRVLIVEPYFGRSHRHLVEGLVARAPFETHLLPLPPRKWKWRMRGGAVVLAGQARRVPPCDVVLASDFLDLPAFLALGPRWLRGALTVVYFHENQLTYPVRAEDERDVHFALTNVTTALAADRVAFNSRFHLAEFTDAIDPLLRKFPDFRPEGVASAVREKARVLPVPLDLREFPPAARKDGPLSILWSSRWEFDKAPETFFGALEALQSSGMDFRLAVLGERFRDCPAVFEEARRVLSSRIEAWGFAESRRGYLETLSRCDVVVSTAIHEFFGIAVAEAVAAGCVPLLPGRLAYPERYPAAFLYGTNGQLRDRLRAMMADPAAVRRENPRPLVADLDWDAQLPAYIELLTP
jgi:glycosyltransferase involved in cell wall biosynthesis